MKTIIHALVAASLLLPGGCAFDVLSTEPEVDIPPERVKDPIYPPKDGEAAPAESDTETLKTN